MKMKNKRIVLITGGTSGIGRALAEAMLEPNNVVIVTGQNEQRLQNMRSCGCVALRANMTSRTQLESLILHIQQHYGRIDLLVNNAGVQYNYNLLEDAMSINTVLHEMHVNATGPIELTMLALPLLYASEQPVIANVTSALSRTPKSTAVVYSASKAAMYSFTTSLKKMLKGKVHVCEIIPPVVETKMTEGRTGRKLSPKEMAKQILLGLEARRSVICSLQIRLFRILSAVAPVLASSIINSRD